MCAREPSGRVYKVPLERGGRGGGGRGEGEEEEGGGGRRKTRGDQIITYKRQRVLFTG